MSRAALLLTALVGASGCFPAADHRVIASPNELMNLTTATNHSKTDRTKYLCIEFSVSDASGNLMDKVQTSASDVHKWAIGWFDDSTIVLSSSDIGACGWKLGEDGSISPLEHPISEELIEFGDLLKAAKYGN